MDKGRLLVEEIKRQQTKRFGRIVVLTGARQVGKTTLLRHQFPNYEYISMDDPQIRRVLLGLSSTQWVSNYPEVILDEVQKERANNSLLLKELQKSDKSNVQMQEAISK